MKPTTKITGRLVVIALALSLMAIAPAKSQTIPLKPCLEHFTASTCAPCGAWAPVFRDILSGYEGDYTIIRYQMYWPGSGDPYYFAESKKRRDYYTITGVPGLCYNGTKQVPYAQYFSTQRMDSLLTLVTGVQIGITSSISADKIVTATITITPEIAYTAGLVAHIVVMEGVTTQNAATNGEKSFNHVAMGFMPNADGTTLGALTPGQPVTLTYTLDMKTTHMETPNDLIVAAFIQDNATKNVLQSNMANVSHTFTDYQLTLHVIDNDYNDVPSGNVFLPYYGDCIFGANGQAVFKGVFPGNLHYTVMAPGYDGIGGDVTIANANKSEDVMIDKPDLLFYEDFGWNKLPAGWDAIKTNGFYIEGSGSEAGSLVLYKPNAGDDDSYLVMPPVGLNQSGLCSFRAGGQYGSPQLKVGIVTLGSEPGTDGTTGTTVTGFTELYSCTVTAFTGYTIFGFPLPETLGNQRLAFKFVGVTGAYCEIDQVAVLEDNPGVKVQFLVTDQNDVPLKSTTVNLNGKTVTNNPYGYATFRDTDLGTYTYSVNYKGQEIAAGNLRVDDALLKQIKYNTSGIESIVTEIPVSIYPNPVRDQFTVEGIQSGTLTVLTMSGQQLMQMPVRNGESVSTTGLGKGLYLVKIECDKKVAYRKILISK